LLILIFKVFHIFTFSRIEFEISSTSINTVHFKSFDFSKIVLKYGPEIGFRVYDRVSTVYKFYYTIHPEGPTSYDKIFSYYEITNIDGSGEFEEIEPLCREYSWDTIEKDTYGNPKYPNGIYTVKVTAIDFKGNSNTESDIVRVNNIN